MNFLSPYHQGELLIQQRAKESTTAQRNSRVIKSTIPPGALRFVGQQVMIAVSSLDKAGRVWISVLIGNPGFITALDASALLLESTGIISHQSDILWDNIKDNPQIGIIVIDLSTRRRLRINGRIHPVSDTQYRVQVEQAYPNCPKYIQRRHSQIGESGISQELPEPIQGSALTVDHKELIAKADSLFVGSASPTLESASPIVENDQHESVSKIEDGEETESPPGNFKHGGDASHRGGNPGFVEVINAQRLRIPDYKGNSMFNTLGNIHSYPKAGLVFVDFECGRVLQLSGDAKILFDEEDSNDKTGGTKRFWEFSIYQWRETKLPNHLSWEFFDYSPHNPRWES